jgi:hypothetical protein
MQRRGVRRLCIRLDYMYVPHSTQVRLLTSKSSCCATLFIGTYREVVMGCHYLNSVLINKGGVLVFAGPMGA